MLKRFHNQLHRGFTSTRASWQQSRCFTGYPLLDELESRGLVAQITSPDLAKSLQKPVTVYCGVDPTAPSIHVGNMVTFMGVLHFHIRGHQVLPLVGGATGTVGDPGGRTTERTLVSKDTINGNKHKLAVQLERFFRHGVDRAAKYLDINPEIPTSPDILDNLTWISNLTLLDFLRDVGKYAKVNVMISRDSVKSRLESSQGISFTEFSYQLLQAYDYFHLYTNYGCRLQIGGADQWGNIIAGIDLIKRRYTPQEGEGEQSEPAYGLTIPLLTTPSGEKFGKSAGNAVWLDSNMTPVLDFYQYFVRQPDESVDRLLRIFTFIPLAQIKEIISKHQEDPGKRYAQRTLAYEATSLVHGETLAHQAQAASRVLYESDIQSASLSIFEDALKGDRRLMVLPSNKILTTPIANILVEGGLVKSKGQVDTLAKQGGLQLNGSKESNPRRVLRPDDFVNGEVVVIGLGTVNYHTICNICPSMLKLETPYQVVSESTFDI
ncbi:tyrosyl-tRNA synthetase [Rhizoctonia solani AG-1 IB]|uniref:Tyrosine--tRNA ligase n=1 Tax=Thanatephorus cucumeris (strain AG1-IB / isolate 7/3/14) TaxID=1108050 RepID=A0A0B7FS84_THACB|nr:tyrosyl-tRNA synthetase [Rhizoctonia solani AG-1 IB]